MEKFTKLGLSKELTDVLKQVGFKIPTEIQEKTIPLALSGKDIIGGSATGSGKTLTFASAIIENIKPNRGVQALILTPTRELAEQIAKVMKDFSKNKNLNVLAVYGGIKIEPQIKKLFKTDILVGTPGRILDHINRKTLRLNEIKFLVLDEVDRMFDMGFSRDVEKIIKRCPEKRQTMMFSATISSDIDYLAKKYTRNPVEISVESYVDPSKLKQIYYDVPNNKKFSLLVHLLKQEGSHFVLVFCSTRRQVDVVANNLIRVGIKAKVIHGGLEQKKRLRVLNEFKKEGKGVLVCTDIAARGLDIDSVSQVYNYDVPTDAKDYVHRIGRTARAGKEGKAIVLLSSRDYERFGILTKSEEFNITSEELPWLEAIKVEVNSGRKNNVKHRNSNRKFSNKGQRRRGRENDKNKQRRFGGASPFRGKDNKRHDQDKPRGMRDARRDKDRPKKYGRSNSSRDSNSRRYNQDKPRNSNKRGYGKRPGSRNHLNKRRSKSSSYTRSRRY